MPRKTTATSSAVRIAIVRIIQMLEGIVRADALIERLLEECAHHDRARRREALRETLGLHDHILSVLQLALRPHALERDLGRRVINASEPVLISHRRLNVHGVHLLLEWAVRHGVPFASAVETGPVLRFDSRLRALVGGMVS